MLLLTFLLACDDPEAHNGDSATDTSDSGGGGGGGGDTAELGPMRIGVPAFIFPGGSDWDTIILSATDVHYVIVNPADGPGSAKDEDWATQISALNDAGIVTLGYIPTDYGNTAKDDVVTMIQEYAEWYSPGGVFLDQVPADDKCDTFQEQYVDEITSVHDMMPGGVGAVAWDHLPCQNWLDQVDVAVTFQGTGADFMAWEPPEWAKDYDPSKFWVIVNTLDEADLSSAIERARNRNVEYFYATDEGLPNPWEHLASYWPQELEALNPS